MTKKLKINASIQWALIFHPSIIHLSDCRVTHSNWKQKNPHCVLLLILTYQSLATATIPLVILICVTTWDVCNPH